MQYDVVLIPLIILVVFLCGWHSRGWYDTLSDDWEYDDGPID